MQNPSAIFLDFTSQKHVEVDDYINRDIAIYDLNGLSNLTILGGGSNGAENDFIVNQVTGSTYVGGGGLNNGELIIALLVMMFLDPHSHIPTMEVRSLVLSVANPPWILFPNLVR